MERFPYVAAYDVSCSRRRHAVHQVLRGNAIGAQRSVYELSLSGGEYQALVASVSGLLDHNTDTCLLVRLDGRFPVRSLGAAVATGTTDLIRVA